MGDVVLQVDKGAEFMVKVLSMNGTIKIDHSEKVCLDYV